MSGEGFEKELRQYESQHITGGGPSGLIRKIASYFYNVRQPEIDALIHDNRHLYKSLNACEKTSHPNYKCKCDMRTKLVGDGCEVCNPELAKKITADALYDFIKHGDEDHKQWLRNKVNEDSK